MRRRKSSGRALRLANKMAEMIDVSTGRRHWTALRPTSNCEPHDVIEPDWQWSRNFEPVANIISNGAELQFQLKGVKA
jgi:hypothetical protein